MDTFQTALLDLLPRLGVTAMERALATLPEEQKLAVAMVLVEGLSYQEASAVLDIPIGAQP